MNENTKITTIGANGLVGSRIIELLSQKYKFTDFSSSSGVDITNPGSLKSVTDITKDYIIVFAAKSDVDGAELEKELGEKSRTFQINVNGIKNTISAVRSKKPTFIYISTDFVFDGNNPPQKGYSEEDKPNPLNWYAKTKYLGEEEVKYSGLPFIILRIGFPYRAGFNKKTDFFRAILKRLQDKDKINAVSDMLITPTFIDDIASAIDLLISKKKTGIFHASGSSALSPFSCANLIAEKFGLDKKLIRQDNMKSFFNNRAPRPFHLKINNGKIRKLGAKMKTFEEGLEEIKNQMPK